MIDLIVSCTVLLMRNFDRCCVKGSLLEINDRLIKQPDLLNASVSMSCGLAKWPMSCCLAEWPMSCCLAEWPMSCCLAEWPYSVDALCTDA
jgi:hypothetical protein